MLSMKESRVSVVVDDRSWRMEVGRRRKVEVARKEEKTRDESDDRRIELYLRQAKPSRRGR